ncbi:MAG: ribonuclease Y [Campylobacterales bacterium]|nr:ribonuclease Y [Campylobacterales bacterium]
MVIEFLIVGGTSALISATATYYITKKLNTANFNIYLEQAKAKAKAIEHEAEILLKNTKITLKEEELNIKERFDKEFEKLNKEFETRLIGLENKEKQLDKRVENELISLNQEKESVIKLKKEIENTKKEIVNIKKEYEAKLNSTISVLESSAGMTKDEAKEYILKNVEEKCRADIAHVVRKYTLEAENEAKKKANYILSQATTRYAGEFAAERLINVVNLPNDELKGRIIGKEGRNIKTLEMLLGVDIIIDDTPNVIILSSFNLYRRAIATKTIELLINDGRVQPAKIEEIYDKVCREFEEKVIEEGENVVIDLGLSPMHPELVKLIGKLRYRASYGQNALGHSLEVAHLASIIAAECGGDEKLARRAGLLHDIGKSLTHEYSGNHVDLGAEVCKRYKEHDVVINAIFAHHGHQEAFTIEAAAVCAADTLSAARPGARREVLESFLKRVQEIEEIANSKHGVTQSYAINAGREIRVITNAMLVNDDEAVLIAREIADEIAQKVQFPGEIKVNVIRETRAIEFAR